MPWRIPDDLKRLKDITMGKPLVMGRKTHESVSAHRAGKPLPGRVHYVVSRTMAPPVDIEGVHVCKNLESAIQQAQAYAVEKELAEIIIFGGAEIYKQALPLVNKIYLTRVHQNVEGDAFFPELDMSQWQEISREDHKTEDELQYSYVTLERAL